MHVQFFKGSEIKIENGITCFDYEFTNTEFNITYYYYTTAFKDTDSFRMTQFSCLAEDKEEMKPVLVEYAKSISFAK